LVSVKLILGYVFEIVISPVDVIPAVFNVPANVNEFKLDVALLI